MFCKNCVFKYFAKFTESTSTRASFLIKLQVCTLSERRPWPRRFPQNFVKFLRISIFIKHLWRLFLSFRIFGKFSLINDFIKKDKNTLTITIQSMFCYDSCAPSCQTTIEALIISVRKLYQTLEIQFIRLNFNEFVNNIIISLTPHEKEDLLLD